MQFTYALNIPQPALLNTITNMQFTYALNIPTQTPFTYVSHDDRQTTRTLFSESFGGVGCDIAAIQLRTFYNNSGLRK